MLKNLLNLFYLNLSTFNIFQTANYRKTYSHRLNWAKRRGGGFDENITNENKEFLDKAVIEKYKIVDSPLKDGPWAKGEFNPNGL